MEGKVFNVADISFSVLKDSWQGLDTVSGFKHEACTITMFP